MSPQHCSLAYADEMESGAQLFCGHLEEHTPTLKLMGRSLADMTAMDDIVEFGGTITVSF